MARVGFGACVLVALSGLAGLPAAADDNKACTDYEFFKAKSEEAIAACTRLIESGRLRGLDLATAFSARAIRHGVRREDDRAIADYDEAIRLNPGFAVLYRSRGELYLHRKKDFDRAIVSLDEAVRLQPEDDYGIYLRAFAHYHKGDFERALADYDTVTRRNPGSIRAYVGRAEVFESRGEFAKAAAELRAALAKDPNSQHSRTVLARLEQKIAAAPTPAQVAPAPPPPPAQVAALPQPAPAVKPAERRVALVIGNGAYRNVAKLPNPGRDAEALAEALRRVGFASVQVAGDLTRDGMIATLRGFEREAQISDWAVIYFAGHGIEVGGVNYLIPIDAALKADKDVQDEAVPLERVLSALESTRKLRLVILDACRDNPFVSTMKRSIASRSIGRGLAQVEPEGGVLVAYAAKHGHVALDGDAANSPFVAALVKRLDTPGLDISLLFRLVRDDVLVSTRRQQEPFVYGSLPGEVLSFRPQ